MNHSLNLLLAKAKFEVLRASSNDFNLNISRYVDTTEEEEEVDIDKVIGEVREIKDRLSENEIKLNGYLRELGFGEI